MNQKYERTTEVGKKSDYSSFQSLFYLLFISYMSDNQPTLYNNFHQ